MPYPTTGPNTELQAVNQILASVGQAPVNTLTTQTAYAIESTGTFTGSISGTTLTTTESGIPVGTFLSGTSVIDNTSVATAGVEVTLQLILKLIPILSVFHMLQLPLPLVRRQYLTK